MKKLIYLLFVISTLVLGTSCKKEYPYPTNDYPANVPTVVDHSHDVSMWGKFVITDATMFVDNHETGEKTQYQHFGSGQTVSSLRLGGSIFDIETIEQNVTTYSFWEPTSNPGTGRFVLNDDTTKLYKVEYMGEHTSIIEDPSSTTTLMGGGSRPFSGWTTDFDNKLIVIHIQQMEGSLNGQNVTYYTELKLKKIEEW